MFDDLSDQIAIRLKELRLQKGWSLDQLAAKSKVSRASLSRFENGDVSPTAAVLGKLCSAYGMRVSQLIAMVEEDGSALVKRSEQSSYSDPDTGMVRLMVSPPSANLDGEVVLVSLRPGTSIQYEKPPILGQQHHLVMLEGALHMNIAGEKYELNEGDSLRYKNFGETHFTTGEKSSATYFLFML